MFHLERRRHRVDIHQCLTISYKCGSMKLTPSTQVTRGSLQEKPLQVLHGKHMAGVHRPEGSRKMCAGSLQPL